MVVAGTTTPIHRTTPFTSKTTPLNGRTTAPNTPRSQSNPRRPPLLVSEKDNGNVGIPAQLRRPKSREVSSRYLSTSSSSSTSNSSSSSTTFSTYSNSSRRCPSPSPSRPHSSSSAAAVAATPLVDSSAIKRAQSAERRRPGTPKVRIPGEMSAAAKLLMSSSRSLSVSFQGESYAVPRGRVVKPVSSTVSPSPPSLTPSLRRGTPERKRNAVTPRKGGENARPSDQPWPGRVVSMSRSVDLGCEGKRLISGGSGKVVRALQESLVSDRNLNRASSDSATLRTSVNKDDSNVASVGSESLVSDVESVSSGGNSGSQDGNSTSNLTPRAMGRSIGGRSIVMPPRHWQESNSLSKRGSEPGSPLTRTSSLKGTGMGMVSVPSSNKPIAARKFVSDSPVGSPRGALSSRGFSSPVRGAIRPSSPVRGAIRPSSPSKVAMDRSSPSTVMGRVASPSRARSAVVSTPSVHCCGAEVRRARVGDNRLGDAHLLRLLHNRHLQWRFVNAKAEASLSVQHFNAERSLYNAWRATSDLFGAVSSKRKELQWLRLKLKLVAILKRQILHLEEWALLDKDHCSSVSGATESLQASTIRLPLVAGARVDVEDLKDAICSAADVMHSMASSICALLRKVEEMNSLVAEVASLTLKEHSFLNECKDILSMLAAMQVKDCSLKAHILQLKCAPSSLAVEV